MFIYQIIAIHSRPWSEREVMFFGSVIIAVALLLLAAAGMRNKEIAAKLCISEETVKSHIRSIFSKTDIDRRSKLVDLLK